MGAIFLSGCSSYQPDYDPSVHYMRDMIIEIDGKAFEGMASVPFKPTETYSVEIEARGDLDLFTMATCAKFLQKESGWDRVEKKVFFGLWRRSLSNKRKTSFRYQQNNLEREQGYCPIYLQGLNKDKGRHSEGVIYIVDQKHSLPAWVNCGINSGQEIGGGVCQLPVDLFAKITFNKEVYMESSCDKGQVYGPKKEWKWQVKKGDCRYHFATKDNEKFMYLMYGFEQSQIRN
jgi:hypothetical protein